MVPNHVVLNIVLFILLLHEFTLNFNLLVEPQSEFDFAKDERELFGSSKQYFISLDKKSEELDLIEPVPSSPMTQVSDGSMYGSDFEAEAHHVTVI